MKTFILNDGFELRHLRETKFRREDISDELLSHLLSLLEYQGGRNYIGENLLYYIDDQYDIFTLAGSGDFLPTIVPNNIFTPIDLNISSLDDLKRTKFECTSLYKFKTLMLYLQQYTTRTQNYLICGDVIYVYIENDLSFEWSDEEFYIDKSSEYRVINLDDLFEKKLIGTNIKSFKF